MITRYYTCLHIMYINYAGAVPKCPIEDDHIKIYLIVQGSFNLVQLALCAVSVCVGIKDKDSILNTFLSCCNLIFTLFLIGWTITGSVWVWKSLDKWQDHHSVCNNTLFISAMICLSLHYVVIMLVCCCCTCMICQVCNREKKYELAG